MRTFTIIVFILVIACLGYLGFAHFSGGAVPTFGLPLGGERAEVRLRTQRFFEHVKFKNANALRDFVGADTPSDEVAQYLFKSMGIKPNITDLTSVHIDEVELNSSETRARVHVTLIGIDLTSNLPFQTSKLLFLYKAPNGTWMIDIKNTGL